jgi:hypothetical protein
MGLLVVGSPVLRCHGRVTEVSATPIVSTIGFEDGAT